MNIFIIMHSAENTSMLCCFVKSIEKLWIYGIVSTCTSCLHVMEGGGGVYCHCKMSLVQKYVKIIFQAIL